VPLGVGKELFETLVTLAQRLEVGRRVGDVDAHGQVGRRGDLPNRLEPPIVAEHELAALVTHAQPDVFPDLQASRSPLGRVAQGPGHAVPPTRRRAVAPVEPAEGGETSGV
jgi:hypothetical protein